MRATQTQNMLHHILLLVWLSSLSTWFRSVTSSPSASPDLSIVTTNLGSSAAHRLPSAADYSRKVSVSVGDVLTRQAAAVAASTTQGHIRSAMGPRSVASETATHGRAFSKPVPTTLALYPDKSWPPEDAEEYNQIDVHVFGERINGATFSYLQPNLSLGTVEKLRVILGADFDNSWMSTEPHDGNRSSGNGSITEIEMPHNQKELIAEAAKMNFTVIEEVAGFGRQEVNLNQRESAVIRRWLVQRASCPVQYVWRDLGNRFWPRWIRHTVCKEGSSCSWPLGMHCKPSGTKTLRLLRWYCSKQPNDLRTKRARRQQPRLDIYRRPRSLYGSAGAAFMPYGLSPRPVPASEPIAMSPVQPLSPNPNSQAPILPLQGHRRQTRRRRITREERRSKRVKRLVRKLSRSFRGYYCEWSHDQYTLQPECSCQCG